VKTYLLAKTLISIGTTECHMRFVFPTISHCMAMPEIDGSNENRLTTATLLLHRPIERSWLSISIIDYEQLKFHPNTTISHDTQAGIPTNKL
jgi:hypothetical protein